MRIDLHAHSRRSDGTDTPSELVEAAGKARLDVVAITDHDNTEGWAEAAEAALTKGIRLVKGVEMTTNCAGSTVHLLGYEFDPEDPTLVAEFARARDMREERVDKILNELRLLGHKISRADVEAAAAGAPIGKPHFNRALVANGLTIPEGTTYKELLKGGQAYVKRTYSVDLADAVRMITEADGKAVVAHPWARRGRDVITPAVLSQLKEVGLAGLEVNHPDHELPDRAELTAMAKELDLAVTGGSDYHGSGKQLPKFALGACKTDVEQYYQLFDCGTPGKITDIDPKC
ncbi:putative metal-dependent phosphoesterase TrpH [Aeromicrobium panaciterrae]|uniref:Metal-dependent phosphoesterase TrpH n=1 Tax=Aeromicrobium panaciterrae TaxID=363861 RepID=A0ABU1UNU3_9ACTN|nr:PHP domain-containing protein [Aeromicrobium panaciterrae]MDR7086849.1 putative metal-dependent phosphoesterase TrpH [Aeromicrobium panaciterrae]